MVILVSFRGPGRVFNLSLERENTKEQETEAEGQERHFFYIFAREGNKIVFNGRLKEDERMFKRN